MEESRLQKFYKDKRVLVTGGAGFIGSHLTEKLVALGARVTILDNCSTGKISNIASVLPYITLHYADIRSAHASFKATINQDIVFHCAALASVPESIKQPELCHKINTEGTLNLLEGCKKNKASRFIFSSSSAVYGQRNGNCSEDDIPMPQSPYAESKLQGEVYCKQYSHDYDLPTASLRYFNVFGPRQNPSGDYAAVVAKFTQLLLNKKPLTIFGDGTQTRDFVHVDTIVMANLALGMLDNLSGDVFNIGSGKSMNLFELIAYLESQLNIQKTELIFEHARQGDILHSHASCDKFNKFLAKI